MKQIDCPECGSLNPEGEENCRVCGKSLLEQVEDCLDMANPDTTCEEGNSNSKRVLWISLALIIIIIVVVTLLLSFAPTPYWG
jgi:uncharacterized membrane protein YvbJ